MEVKTIAVIGAGTLGRGIAQAAALAGYRTILEDLLPSSLRRAESEIRTELEQEFEQGTLGATERTAALGRLHYADGIDEAVAEADMVMEAVPEEIDSKLEIFTTLDKMAPPRTIIASVTASLSLTELAGMTYRARRCVGMHFTHPVSGMKLLEVIRGLETDDESVAAAVTVARRLGKEPIVVRESAGYITARVQALIGNEAFALLQEGVASAADIDKAFTLGLKHATGPFSQMDQEGLDNRLHLLERLHQTLGEKFRPHPLLVQYVKAGRLGKKSGKGIFEYPDEPRR